MTVLLAVLALCTLAGLWCIAVYNGLVRARNLVVEARSGMDVQLKRRADLVPNLVETVKSYMGHERGVLESVTGLRAKIDATADPDSRLAMEGQLGTALSRLFAVAENYPALRASDCRVAAAAHALSEFKQFQLKRIGQHHLKVGDGWAWALFRAALFSAAYWQLHGAAFFSVEINSQAFARLEEALLAGEVELEFEV